MRMTKSFFKLSGYAAEPHAMSLRLFGKGPMGWRILALPKTLKRRLILMQNETPGGSLPELYSGCIGKPMHSSNP